MILALFGLFIALCIDIVLLKEKDLQLFEQTFTIALSKAIFGILLIILILIFSVNRLDDLPVFILLFILPLYLLRRQQFTTNLKTPVHKSLQICSDALGVIVAWIYGVLVFGLLISSIADAFTNTFSQMGEMIISAIFSSILIICLIYRASEQFSDHGFLANVGLRKGPQSWKKIIIPSVVLGLFFAFFSSYITVTRQIQPATPLNEVIAATQSFGLMIIFLILAICIAPLIEEIIFRGYFFHVVKEWIGTRKAIYIIALTFAFLHVGQYWGDWLAIVMVTLLGFTLTMLRAWTGTTLASVITHYVYNGSVTIIPVIMIAVSNPAYFEYKTTYPTLDVQTKEALLKKAIADQPDLVEAYNDLAWLYAEEEKNLDLALELVEKALKFSPQQPAYLDTKAKILEKLGRTNEAEEIRTRLLGK